MEEVAAQTITQQKILPWRASLWLRITPIIKIFLYLIPLFAVPFFLWGPQLLVGSIVNLLLILVALKYKNYAMIIPMVMLPSIATSLRGLVFWPFTIFLVYMMPAIWLGNFILVYVIQHIKTQRLGILVWWILKTIFLFLIAYILIKLWVLPAIFLKAMGIFQLITVMIAGVIYTSFIKLFK
jgi:hypothetical protein